MARHIEQAGLRVLELNIGTPYASQARGVVATELDPERVRTIVAAVRAAIAIPLWVKLTGQSERVPDLARAAFEGGADSVVMAGRLLGLIPDIETFEPMLGTTLGRRRFLEPAAHMPLACTHPITNRRGAPADRHQRSPVRTRHRPHDACRRDGGRDRLAGDAARFRSALRRARAIRGVPDSQELCALPSSSAAPPIAARLSRRCRFGRKIGAIISRDESWLPQA